MDLVDIEARWSKCLRHTLLLPLLCVFKIASPWCLGAASLSHDLCHGRHGTDVPRAKTSELKLLIVNPQFTVYPSFPTDDLQLLLMLGTTHLLFYSCPEILVKIKIKDKDEDHDLSHHLAIPGMILLVRGSQSFDIFETLTSSH